VALNKVNIIGIESSGGQDRPAIFFLNAQNYISAIEIEKVVCKSTHGMYNIILDILIPPRLELQQVALNRATEEQIF
jgi:hypothetical protein